jgi:hypothetical protein
MKIRDNWSKRTFLPMSQTVCCLKRWVRPFISTQLYLPWLKETCLENRIIAFVFRVCKKHFPILGSSFLYLGIPFVQSWESLKHNHAVYGVWILCSNVQALFWRLHQILAFEFWHLTPVGALLPEFPSNLPYSTLLLIQQYNLNLKWLLIWPTDWELRSKKSLCPYQMKKKRMSQVLMQEKESMWLILANPVPMTAILVLMIHYCWTKLIHLISSLLLCNNRVTSIDNTQLSLYMSYKRKVSYSQYLHIQLYSITFSIQSYKCIRALCSSGSLCSSSHVCPTHSCGIMLLASSSVRPSY